MAPRTGMLTASSMTFVLGLGLSALSVNRANRPVTRWCRHGAAIALAFMICTMHYTLTASATATHAAIGGAASRIDSGQDAGPRRGRRRVAGDGQRLFDPISSTCVRAPSPPIGSISSSFNDTMTGLPNRIAFNERLAFDAAEVPRTRTSSRCSRSISMASRMSTISWPQRRRSAADRIRGSDAPHARPRRIHGPPERRRVSGVADVRQSSARCAGLCGADRANVRGAAFRAGRTGQSYRLDRLSRSFRPIHRTAISCSSNAKLAMHRGKSKQRGSISIIEREMDDAARARRALARDLQQCSRAVANWTCTINCRQR